MALHAVAQLNLSAENADMQNDSQNKKVDFANYKTPEIGRFCIRKTFFEHAKLHCFAHNFLCYKKQGHKPGFYKVCVLIS
jgi:hypothetical protein